MGPPPSPPWRLLLYSRNLTLMSFSEFGVNLGWAFVVTLLPDYLAETFAVPIEERGTMASVPLMVGSIGMLAGGWLTDFLTRRLGLRWGRGAQQPEQVHLGGGVSRLPVASVGLGCGCRHGGDGGYHRPGCADSLGVQSGHRRASRRGSAGVE